MSKQLSFWGLILLSALSMGLAQLLHESGHRIPLQVLGYQPVWAFTRLVQIWDTPPQEPSQWVETSSPDGETGWLKLASRPSPQNELLFLAGGPLASVLTCLVGQWISRRGSYPFTRDFGRMLALSTAFALTFYYLRGPWRTGGDEGFMASAINIPKLLLDLPLGIFFATCLFLAFRQLPDGRTRLTWLGALLLGNIPLALSMNLADSLLITPQVDAGNPFFAAFLGFSFPVFATNFLICLGLALWWLHITQKRLTNGFHP